ncbi:P-loop containing nucleoside triphosphate hydrolase protein [Trametes versicolor FP-101664 SS1]|uniref:P-loop containing nucleoside triphosphate hydrolase protein n=1 Tax=Trametes versicolor (strain FP-101664) TaxID=717944 RepID=UPI00046217B2|nr:P-loop containing nucleoside triphosphate hydrolase protein [Trametes versicolor FP-101664 SS1]EIW53710.1 P-loop containing nucleoside triphosphate hydrolase protein [Trametes versicolor FP-101664 SS1]
MSLSSSMSSIVWTSTAVIPAYCAAFSAVILLVTAIQTYGNRRASAADASSSPEPDHLHGSRTFLGRRLYSIGGIAIATCRLIQLLVVLGLLGISASAILRHDSIHESAELDIQIAQCAFYIYVGMLGLLAIFGNPPLEQRVFAHASILIAVTWCVYMYRDVWPLATFTESPADLAEGKVLWAKVALLFLGGVALPLLTPRQYIPLNPKNTQRELAPEQTASILSILSYSFVESVVWKAWSVPRLTYEMLPPLPEYDYLTNLKRKSFPYLDPLQAKSRRHIAFGLIRIFGSHLGKLAVVDFVMAVVSFGGPLSVNRLLTYLATGGVDAQIRPWFWIVLFFFSTSTRDTLIQWLTFNYTRINIRVQAIVTDLVFEHALRIRVKAGTAESVDQDEGEASDATVVGTPDSQEATSQDDGATGNAADSSSTPTSAAAKGKAKAPQKLDDVKVDRAEKNVHLMGRINNLVSSDLQNLNDLSMMIIFWTVEMPFHVLFCTIFLYKVLGWSGVVGIVITACLLPIPGYFAKRVKGLQTERMKRTDARVQTVTEMMNVIRMIKLFGWEDRMATQLDEKREAELKAVRKTRILNACLGLFNYSSPYLVMVLTFATYTVIFKHELTGKPDIMHRESSAVFSSMTVFEMLRRAMAGSFMLLPMTTQAWVSLGRISDFLWETELIDEFAEGNRFEGTIHGVGSTAVPEDRSDVVGIRHASFTWSIDSTATSRTPGRTRKRHFVLTVDDELLFQRGKINLIVGPTSSGKTSLLMALLGELHFIPSGPDSYVNLPRENGVAYAAQESWVQNDTIRNNIVFGAPYDQVRYDKVIEQCALQQDLSLFEAGDQTEVGEKGITLSGGQKARITLARAVYSSADILLLDDILAALDVHTSKWIVEQCFKGDLLQGRTIILVTHNVALVSPVADFVVDMDSHGRILSQGSLANVLEHDSHLVKEVIEEREEIEKAEIEASIDKPEDAMAKQTAGKLVIDEEIEVGHVGWTALKLFLGNTSNRPVLFWLVFVVSQTSHHALMNLQSWYLGHWASQYETRPSSEVSLLHYLSIYAAIVVVMMMLVVLIVFWILYGSIRAARIVHRRLIRSVLCTTLRWLDRTPTARIITRCTEDMQTVDNGIAGTSQVLVDMTVFVILKFVAVVIFTPIYIFPSIVVAILGGFLGNVYMKGQLSTKRELSNAKAPVLGHFGAAISGITSIRAYGAQEAFKKELSARVDKYSRVYVMHENFNRWISVRMDFTGTVFASTLAAYIVYGSRLSASDTGFSINTATALSGMIFYVVRYLNMFEVQGDSLERIHQYLSVEQEPTPISDGVPPAYWPASGHLVVENLSARYSPDGPKVLHDVSFEVAPGERVGIVGRTGSGKARFRICKGPYSGLTVIQSSLTLALLRCILTEGNVLYDGLATDKLNLDALRSNITIIPQVPELLSGTLRQNLDPFAEYDDALLNDALRSAGLFNLQEEGDKTRITLDTEIAGGGANLSVGQRQILALARAIVRRSKLLILDEATSAIDYETDAIIQTSLRTELGKDVTLLTVAHRLQTIMDADKIMVLDAGRLVEFGKPSELLENEKGLFRALVDESGDREKLYATAMGASAS